jgi:peptidoglycan/xylan/chitin deacetylase (PgdA/CDA1 family)
MTTAFDRHFVNAAFAWIPVRLLSEACPFRLVLPYYHCVADETPPHILHLYQARDTRSFRKDLEKLTKYYRPVGARDVLLHVSGEKPFVHPSMLLSFDDGLRDAAETIAPMLASMGIPAVFFVNSAFIDNRALFYRFKVSLLIERLKHIKSPEGIYEIISGRNQDTITSERQLQRYLLNLTYHDDSKINDLAELFQLDFSAYLKIRKPYMTSGHVSELIGQGFDVGAHSIDHPLYASIPLEEQLRQTRESLDWLRRNFKVNTACFSFPFTDYGVSPEFFEEIFSDHPGNPDLTFGTAGFKDDIYSRHLQRISVKNDSLGIKGLLRSEYILYRLKKMVGKNSVTR